MEGIVEGIGVKKDGAYITFQNDSRSFWLPNDTATTGAYPSSFALMMASLSTGKNIDVGEDHGRSQNEREIKEVIKFPSKK